MQNSQHPVGQMYGLIDNILGAHKNDLAPAQQQQLHGYKNELQQNASYYQQNPDAMQGLINGIIAIAGPLILNYGVNAILGRGSQGAAGGYPAQGGVPAQGGYPVQGGGYPAQGGYTDPNAGFGGLGGGLGGLIGAALPGLIGGAIGGSGGLGGASGATGGSGGIGDIINGLIGGQGGAGGTAPQGGTQAPIKNPQTGDEVV